MRNIVIAAFVATVLLAAFAVPISAGQFEDGVAAAEKGDYATAFQLWRPLAEQGNAAAQHNLGLLYNNGQGVALNYAEAVRWYRKAAEQDQDDSQNSLGVMYVWGRGVRQDHVLAFMWLDLAAGHGNESAKLTRYFIAKRMSPAQIAEAQRLAREWRPK